MLNNNGIQKNRSMQLASGQSIGNFNQKSGKVVGNLSYNVCGCSLKAGLLFIIFSKLSLPPPLLKQDKFLVA